MSCSSVSNSRPFFSCSLVFSCAASRDDADEGPCNDDLVDDDEDEEASPDNREAGDDAVGKLPILGDTFSSSPLFVFTEDNASEIPT